MKTATSTHVVTLWPLFQDNAGEIVQDSLPLQKCKNQLLTVTIALSGWLLVIVDSHCNVLC